MAAATIVDTAFTSGGSVGALTMPATPPTAGQVYVAVVWGDSDSTATMTSTGSNTWSDVSAGYGSNGTQGTSIFKSECVGDGNDAGSVTSPKARLARVFLVDGADFAGIIAAYGNTNSIDPPSLALGSSKDWRFIAAARTNSSNLTASPSGYSAISVGNYLGIVYGGVGHRSATTSGPENPGAFTGTTSSAHAVTIAIPPTTIVTHQGAAALSADSTLTAAGTPVRPAAASMSATATLTAVGAPVRPAAAALSADSALTAAGTRIVQGAASLSADSTMSAAGSLLAPAADLFATSTLTATAVVTRTGAAAAMVAETTLTVDLTSEQNAEAQLVAASTLTAGATRVHQASATLTAETDLLAGTASVQLAGATMLAQSSLTATAFVPTAKPIEFRDMAVSVTPPSGHFKPMPLLLGADWQPNDVRILIVSAYGAGQGGVHQPLPMDPPLPPGWTAAYDLSSGGETKGVFWRRLQEGDQATSVAWAKPPSWGNFLFVTLTARGVDPGTDLIAGTFAVHHQNGTTTATTSSVSFPTDGSMLFCVATIPDPGSQSWPNWPSAMGVPIGWEPMTATDNSGANFDGFNADPNVLVVGKSYPAAGSTGETDIPVAIGRPAFISMYVFLRPAPDVTISVGAA